jgi:UDP-N-acetylglucosamine 2-epimerase (non-hydrolysing)
MEPMAIDSAVTFESVADQRVSQTSPHDEPRSDGSVALVFGTRPEIIKLAGIIKLLGSQARAIYSGQHFDPLLSRVFFDDLQLPAPAVALAVGGRSRGHQIGELVLRLEQEFAGNRPAAVVVQGDTNTTLGGALAANASEIPLIHVEAGLRSFDRRMPEEHNRIVADHLADLCLAPTEQARANLIAEGVPNERIVVTGNTVVDVASRLVPAPAERSAVLDGLGLAHGGFVLATFHRPENVDNVERLAALLGHLAALDLPVLFPVHPRTQQRIDAYCLERSTKVVKFIEPVGYRTFLALAAECAFLLSDSGGVQEEASVVKRPAIIVRRSTERPEVLGTFATLVQSLADLPAATAHLVASLEETHRRLAELPTPYGDGHASARCVQHIESRLRGAVRRVV